MKTKNSSLIRVADEVWIATALLHRENPGRADFSIEEIVERAARENLAGINRPGVYAHAVSHCVANRRPSPNRCMMLFESGAGRRRLFRKGDTYDVAREGSKVTPAAEGIPEEYQSLLSWYREWSRESTPESQIPDPLLALAGSGASVWTNETGDEYVKRLRQGWE
ncbi:MAG TPA: hypothetical protein VGD60_17780 [Candidatus Acidoferrales bacterium]